MSVIVACVDLVCDSTWPELYFHMISRTNGGSAVLIPQNMLRSRIFFMFIC